MTENEGGPGAAGGWTPERAAARYALRLYVAGLTPASTVAVSRVKEVCEECLPGRYDLEVVDIYQQPQLAAKAQIIAVPTLVRELPGPLRKLIGDLSSKERLLVGLGLEKRET